MKFKGILLALLGWSLGAIAQEIPASKATLSLDNVSLRDALREISRQTGNNTTARVAGMGENKISLNVKDQPYWSVIQEICEKKKLGIAEYRPSGASDIVLVEADEGNPPTFISGAFRARIKGAESRMTRDFRSESRVFLVDMEIGFEPKAGVFKCAQAPIIERAETADGVSLAPDKGNKLDPVFRDSLNLSAHAMRLELPYKSGVKSLKTLSGKIWVIQEVKSEDWVIETDKAVGATKTVCDLDTLKIMELKLQGERIELKMEISTKTRNENLMSGAQIGMRIRYEGLENSENVSTGLYSGEARMEGGKEIWTCSFGTWGQDGIKQMPSKMIIHVPTEVKAVAVGFEFHDLAMP